MFNVGGPKSGTHSIASMFDSTVRAAHEPEPLKLISMLLAYERKSVSHRSLVGWVNRRNRRLGLNVDSSHLNWHILEILLSVTVEAKILLTVRDCYSMLNSQLNNYFRHGASRHSLWINWRNARLGSSAFNYNSNEGFLKANNLPNLKSYIEQWQLRISTTEELVPAKQLLVVRTEEIPQRAKEIAEFAGLPVSSLKPEGAHAYQHLSKKNYLLEFSESYIEDLVQRYAGQKMRQYFPELRNLGDVLPAKLGSRA